jgi:hypothetical protein
METTTPFDLNCAIQHWRDGLAQSPAIRAENLDELETHLRDSVATLQSRELSAEEAFLIATKRVGRGAVLVKEFGKVNPVNVWVERCLWGLVALQLWSIFQTFFWAVSFIAQIKINRGLIDSFSSLSAFMSVVIFTVFPIALSALVLWRLFQSSRNRFGNILERLSNKPLVIAIIVFVVNAGLHLVNYVPMYFAGRSSTGVEWIYYTRFFADSFLYAGIIFLLARKRLLRKA